MAHIVADWIKETASNKPDGSTAFNLPDSGYTGGYASFDSVMATNDTCFYTATNGTARETGLGTFTAGSPDTLTRTTILSSSTGSAIDFSGGGDVTVELVDPARQVFQSWMAHVAGTDAATTMVANHMYVVDMSAWATADRTYTLPASAKAGDRVGIIITTGDASHELVITAASGDTLNGVSGGTEWSRLFITGEAVVMRCVADDATWVVEHDGRIPQAGVIRVTTAGTVNTGATSTRASEMTNYVGAADVAIGCTVANGSGASGWQITVRRKGRYAVSSFWITSANVNSTSELLVNVTATNTAAGGSATVAQFRMITGGSAALGGVAASCDCVEIDTDGVVTSQLRTTGTDNTGCGASTNLRVTELL